MVVIFFGSVRIDTAMAMIVVVIVLMAVMVVGGQRMGDQVQERVSQQSAGREAQEYFQERLVFVFVFDGNEEEYEERQDAYGHGGRQRFYPQHRIDGRGLRLGVAVVMVATVVVVTVARAHFRKSQEDHREQQRPANVLQAFLGHRHGRASAEISRVLSRCVLSCRSDVRERENDGVETSVNNGNTASLSLRRRHSAPDNIVFAVVDRDARYKLRSSLITKNERRKPQLFDNADRPTR